MVKLQGRKSAPPDRQEAKVRPYSSKLNMVNIIGLLYSSSLNMIIAHLKGKTFAFSGNGG